MLSLAPQAERLEERLVLSTVTWNSTANPTGGSWDLASNWVGGQLPGATDDVVINLASTGTVTLDAGVTNAVKSLTTNTHTNINISNDSLSLAATSSIGGRLTQTGGALSGSGTLTVSGLTTWTGDTSRGAESPTPTEG